MPKSFINTFKSSSPTSKKVYLQNDKKKTLRVCRINDFLGSSNQHRQKDQCNFRIERTEIYLQNVKCKTF